MRSPSLDCLYSSDPATVIVVLVDLSRVVKSIPIAGAWAWAIGLRFTTRNRRGWRGRNGGFETRSEELSEEVWAEGVGRDQLE